jgi:ATP-dependent Lhr-like helicase
VNASARRTLLESPSGVLLITPESLEAMFVLRATLLPMLFSKLDFVVIDELHAFLESERGAQLRSQLYRLRLRAGCNPTRVGLSATIGDPDRALRWLRPEGSPATSITSDGAESSLRLRVRGIWKEPREENESAEADAGDASLTELARAILLACRGKTNLVFANAKAQIEGLADELTSQAAAMNLPDEIVVHHGSLSKERREHAEARLREAAPCTAICSNTLEMGIDVGEISEVVQVSAPWSVASLKQRLGRSGRRADKGRVLRAYFVEERPTEKSDVWDRLHLGFIQGLATIELMLTDFLEPPETERSHFSTLIHQVLSIIAETGGVTAVALHERAVSGAAFGAVSRSDFGTVLRELGRRDLIEQMPDGTLVLGMKGQKIVEHYSFYAAFNASSELRVVCGSDEIGTVALSPPPGEHLILAGRRWRVEDVDTTRREVLVSPARGRRAPWYQSRGGAVHRAIHEKMAELLAGTAVPPYLDAVATEILKAARETAAQCGGFGRRAQPFATGVRLFVWGGSRIQQTLAIAFAAAGITRTDEDVGFDVEATPKEVQQFLRQVARDPNTTALGAFADERMRLRELGREKFEPFMPSELWRRAFVREQLDIDGTVEVAAKLADGLVVAEHGVS